MQPGRRPIRTAVEIMAEIQGVAAPVPPPLRPGYRRRVALPDPTSIRRKREESEGRIAQVLREAMVARGITVHRLAGLVGSGRSHLNLSLTGYRPMTRELATDCAEQLDLKLDQGDLARLNSRKRFRRGGRRTGSVRAVVPDLDPGIQGSAEWVIRKTIDERRLAMNWSLKQLAEKSGYVEYHVRTTLSGKQAMEINEAQDLLAALGLSLQFAIRRNDEK